MATKELLKTKMKASLLMAFMLAILLPVLGFLIANHFGFDTKDFTQWYVQYLWHNFVGSYMLLWALLSLSSYLHGYIRHYEQDNKAKIRAGLQATTFGQHMVDKLYQWRYSWTLLGLMIVVVIIWGLSKPILENLLGLSIDDHEKTYGTALLALIGLPMAAFIWFVRNYEKSRELAQQETNLWSKEFLDLLSRAATAPELPEQQLEQDTGHKKDTQSSVFKGHSSTQQHIAIRQLQDYLTGAKWPANQRSNSTAIFELFSSLILQIKQQYRLDNTAEFTDKQKELVRQIKASALIQSINAVLQASLVRQGVEQNILQMSNDSLQNMDLDFLNFSNINLSALNCLGISLAWTDLFRTNLSAADLSDANLRRANLSRANLSAADLSAADLSRTNLRRANLSRANLSAAYLRCANLSAADLRRADFRAADLSTADLRDADLRHADFRDADLRHADFRDADFRVADLRVANLSVADLSTADLRDADLSAAYLRCANLSDADLRRADFRAADLCRADFRAADLRDANLCGRYQEETQEEMGLFYPTKLMDVNGFSKADAKEMGCKINDYTVWSQKQLDDLNKKIQAQQGDKENNTVAS